FNSLGFLVVEWGQGGVLPAIVAADHSRAGALLGTRIVWRCAAALGIYPMLIGLCQILGYDYEVQVVVTLYFIGYTVSAITNAGQFLTIGLERTEGAAYRQIL